MKRKEWKKGRLVVLMSFYFVLLLVSIFFMGPFVFGFVSSFKDNPTEWPPRFSTEQLKWRNWKGAYFLARQVGKSGLWGSFDPGKVLRMKVVYFAQEETAITLPQGEVPKRQRFAGGQMLRDERLAGDYVKVEIREVERRQVREGWEVVFEVILTNASEFVFERVPLDMTVESGMRFVKADLAPNRIERRGKVQGWNNISSGVIPYIFHQYNRVFGENYSRIDGKPLFYKWIFNSFLYAFLKVVTTVLFASMAGYALARLNFFGKNVLFGLMLFSMMVPGQVTFISNYLVLRDGLWGLSKLFGVDTLLNTYTGLVVQGLVAASSVFIFKQFFESLPASYEESARIDGASTYQIFFRIALPLAKPAMGAVAILSFQGAWNDFFAPLVIITSPADKFPLTVGLNSFQKTYAAGAYDWGPLLAGAFVSAVPVLILFFMFQRYFVEGVSFSGLKD
ncbi:MAG: carbohydrate ABC transporter permease [Brevinematales bacterium]|nr:carbohydrate ABC transporter permease [Brevinematales bacterium]